MHLDRQKGATHSKLAFLSLSQRLSNQNHSMEASSTTDAMQNAFGNMELTIAVCVIVCFIALIIIIGLIRG